MTKIANSKQRVKVIVIRIGIMECWNNGNSLQFWTLSIVILNLFVIWKLELVIFS